MAVETRFIPHTLGTISAAVVEIIAKTGLHVRRDGISNRLARRVELVHAMAKWNNSS